MSATVPSVPPIVLFPSSAGIGGLEVHVVELGRGLVARGVTVGAVCLRRPDLEPLRIELEAAGVRVHVLGGREASPLAAARRLQGLVNVLRDYQAAIVHLHYGGYGGGELIQIAAGLAGSRAVVRTEHVPPVPPFTLHGRLLVHARDHFLARIICVAEQNRAEHIQKLHRRPEKFVVIPNGIDLSRYQPTPPDPGVLRELGFEPEARLVGTVARLTERRKRIDLFVDMAADVLRTIPDVRFVVVGEGDLRPELERQAEGLGIGDKVRFVGERSDVPRLLAAMRVFVMPSTYEAGPLTVLEALAMGRPVVATPVGIIPDVIGPNGRGGRMVPVGQHEAMARATMDLLADDVAANQLGILGRQRVVSNFSIDAMVDRTLDLYREVSRSAS